MSDLLAGALIGFFLGIIAGVVANKTWELWTRSRSHTAVKKLAGEWVAHKMLGRNVDSKPMPGSTVISPTQSRWSADAHVLEVRGHDISEDGRRRDHSGFIAIDTTCPWRATRTIRYLDSDEISEQRIEISRDGNTLYVFPDAPEYHKHALVRKN
jgi:hypothetical protein